MSRNTTAPLSCSWTLIVVALGSFLPTYNTRGQAEEHSGQITVASAKVSQVCERWNTAVRHVRNQEWNRAATVFVPDDREFLLSRSIMGGAPTMSLFLSHDISPESQRILVYQDSSGNCLASIYGERTWECDNKGNAIRLCSRVLLATMTKEKGAPWLLKLLRPDKHAFGVGSVVEGIGLSVTPEEQTISSWRDLQLAVALKNMSESRTISVQRHPSVYLQENLAIGLLAVEPQSREKAFNKWYQTAEATSAPPISGLFHSIAAIHTPLELKPGESRVSELRMDHLCWLGPDVPHGPDGTFRLFLVYDPNREWDPVEAALPVWRHRIASNPFVVKIVAPTKQPAEVSRPAGGPVP